MRNASHDKHTWLGALRTAVEAWRKSNGWSRETAVMAIVEAHERAGFEAHTGIKFDPPTRDTFERAKVNADRVFRWLDDVTKDNNHCPPNFLPSILIALPMEYRWQAVNQWLMDVGMCARLVEHSIDEDTDTTRHFKDVVNSAAKSQTALADLLDGEDPGELQRAHTALAESVRESKEAMHHIEHRLAGLHGGEKS